MHAQTILQLYRQLTDAGHDDPTLAQVRTAYELARQLFVGCYRPSEKPFCAHLVGTASALARWGERSDMVIAGLLHSAYLYGEFGDRTRGISPAKQDVLSKRVGKQVEELVACYSAIKEHPMGQLDGQAPDPQSRDVIVLKLADLYDECADGGPLYSPEKTLWNGLPHNRDARQVVLSIARQLVSPTAQEDLDSVFQEIDSRQVPEVLLNQKQAYHTAQPGVPELRISKTRRRLGRLAKRFSPRRAA